MSDQIALAEAQLLGWNAHRQGTSIVELCNEMGLTLEEWNSIKDQYGLGYMRESDKEEIEQHLKNL